MWSMCERKQNVNNFSPHNLKIMGYKFDPDSKSCIKFVGGGCRLSNNGFGTKEDCEAKCSTSNVKSTFIHFKEFLRKVIWLVHFNQNMK